MNTPQPSKCCGLCVVDTAPKTARGSQSVEKLPSEIFEGENNSLRKTFETVSQSVEWEKEFEIEVWELFEKVDKKLGRKKDVNVRYSISEGMKPIIQSFISFILSVLVEKMERLKEKRWIEHGRDCIEGRRPCGAIDHPAYLADRCENKSHDSKTISAAMEVVKKMGV